MDFQNSELVKLLEETPMMPPNRGFAGTPVDNIIGVGSVVDRYGSNSGEFLYAGNPLFLFRSLPVGAQQQPHWFYEVKREFIAKLGRACSWYAQPGGSMLIDLGIGNTVQDLIDQGILVEITPPSK
jgi:hypothetical protein